MFVFNCFTFQRIISVTICVFFYFFQDDSKKTEHDDAVDVEVKFSPGSEELETKARGKYKQMKE